ncbi:MAG: 50S ribosomal protein L23 [Candidatus Omnitrophica bacterium CG11_big_fil_rev_8_21_14_0_20_45_26]|uniref:Large ribosomal subunit protein uL23 n=1 Tax=Candidatus Abzuiibacterium crystallinum TaxID=1974748 RepID=A0A2H0LNH3_9BACT|nr:MAG: 50S ribosomal protein L23 [Candidatus Omnitrophica bacterium CG11_big_fil_rev_8_21_14_0_20_45_26]PIW65106.1 MAG: 50S ribosomal protein L23 [Candidatus Omnitrophica bacterium CG12_big_fil_rev_8_21_14_0_65_45_16]
MSLHLYEIIQQPWITEKGSSMQAKQNKFQFRVHPKANKNQIKRAVEEIFNVKVLRVHTAQYGGKWKRVRLEPGKTNDWKKAIVTLKAGQTIELS